MTISSTQRIALTFLLLATAGCGTSKPAGNDGSGGRGSGGVAGTGGSGGAGTAGSGGSTGNPGSGGSAGNDGGQDTSGAAGRDAAIDTTGTAGSDGGTADTTTDRGGADVAMTTMMITAATGGSVTVSGGTLKIPAGALAADTTITVKESAPGADTPNKDQINGLIYDFGPDGTTFKAPVELTLPLAGTIAAGKSALIAFLDARTKVWVPLSSSVVGTAGAQKVTALLTHFTPYAVLIVPTGGVCPASAACGGSVLGTWELVAFCQSKPPESTSVDCGDGTTEYARATYDLGGTFTVAADNTYTLSESVGITRTVNDPPGCIARANTILNPKIMACADLVPGLNQEFSVTTTMCAGTVTDGCTCVAKTTTPVEETGTISVSGTNFTTTKTGGQPSTSAYCVQGGVLTVTTSDGSVYTGVKKP